MAQKKKTAKKKTEIKQAPKGKKLNDKELEKITGGMDMRCQSQSTNVEDRR